jgi:hypothetical protein
MDRLLLVTHDPKPPSADCLSIQLAEEIATVSASPGGRTRKPYAEGPFDRIFGGNGNLAEQGDLMASHLFPETTSARARLPSRP